MSGNLGGYAHAYDELNRPAYGSGNKPRPLASNLLGTPIIQEWGGWRSPDVLREIYTHVILDAKDDAWLGEARARLDQATGRTVTRSET